MAKPAAVVQCASLPFVSLGQMEREQIISQRVEQAVSEIRKQAGEEKQRILMDASRQMREAIRESNKQSNAREVASNECLRSACDFS